MAYLYKTHQCIDTCTKRPSCVERSEAQNSSGFCDGHEARLTGVPWTCVQMQREVAGDASCGDFLQSWDPDAGALSSGRSGGDSIAGVVDGTRSTEVPAGWLSDLGRMRQNAAECASPSVASTTSADDTNTSYFSTRTTNSVDGMVSRSSTRSTCSRDSIAPVVKETFGDLVDKLRTVEGRESTFQEWPHAKNPRLSPEAMARAGFIFLPDSEAADKVPPRERIPCCSFAASVFPVVTPSL